MSTQAQNQADTTSEGPICSHALWSLYMKAMDFAEDWFDCEREWDESSQRRLSLEAQWAEIMRTDGVAALDEFMSWERNHLLRFGGSMTRSSFASREIIFPITEQVGPVSSVRATVASSAICSRWIGMRERRRSTARGLRKPKWQELRAAFTGVENLLDCSTSRTCLSAGRPAAPRRIIRSTFPSRCGRSRKASQPEIRRRSIRMSTTRSSGSYLLGARGMGASGDLSTLASQPSVARAISTERG
jgi:hypothetical protein